MKRGNNISMGPGAASLILIAVMLSMSVLGMLSLMTARNDRKLSERSAAVAEKVYGLNAAAEETRAGLEEMLAEIYDETGPGAEEIPEETLSRIKAGAGKIDPDIRVQDGSFVWTEENDAYLLTCEVSFSGSADENGNRTRWICHQLEAVAGGWEDDEWNF